MPARADKPDGICCAPTPAVSSKLASASTGSTGRCPGRMRMQRQEELPVRETIGQLVRRVHRKGRLADPGHPADRADPHHVPAGGRHRGSQPGELGRAAGEAGDIARQRPGRRRRRRGFAGCQHLARRGTPARRRLEQRPPRPGQTQRTGQQPGRVLARRQVHTPLQVTDRPRGNTRRLREILLRQPRIGPQLPQQAAETERRLLRHGSRLHRTPAPFTREVG